MVCHLAVLHVDISMPVTVPSFISLFNDHPVEYLQLKMDSMAPESLFLRKLTRFGLISIVQRPGVCTTRSALARHWPGLPASAAAQPVYLMGGINGYPTQTRAIN